MSELPDLSAPSPADGPTTPGRPAVARPDSPADRPTDRLGPAPTVPARHPAPARRRWPTLVLGVVALAVLLVLVLGNLDPTEVSFLGVRATLPLGVWLLVAAVVGALLTVVVGLVRTMTGRRIGRRGR